MNLKTLLSINAVVALIFGLAFLLFPEATVTLYGNTLNAGGLVVARLFGAAFVGFAVLNWLAREAPASIALRAIVLAMFVGDALGFLVSLIHQLAGDVDALGWTTVTLYLLFALGFGYFAFFKKETA